MRTKTHISRYVAHALSAAKVIARFISVFIQGCRRKFHRFAFADEFEYMVRLQKRVGVVVSGPTGMDVLAGDMVRKHSTVFGKSRLTLHTLSFKL